MSDQGIQAADVLRAVGMHPKYKGYAYLLYILRLTQSCPMFVHYVGVELYAAVAKEFNVSVASVERNIRFAIKRTWEGGNNEELKHMFGVYDVSYIPTNNEFIAVLTECLQHRRVKPMQMTLAL